MKQILSVLLCVLICLSFSLPVFAGELTVTEDTLATKLFKLGLLEGVGKNDDGTVNFDLSRRPDRAEALVMLIRMLGKDDKAKDYGKTHPFSDVPEWADGYVSYAYDFRITNGVSDTLFDPKSPVGPEMYLTFVLRALRFSDLYNRDFSWDNPWQLADFCDILPKNVNKESFCRGDMVYITAAALFSHLKHSGGEMLYESLIDSGVFTNEQFAAVFPQNPFNQSAYKNALSRTRAAIGYVKEVIETPLCTIFVGDLGAPRPAAVIRVVYKPGGEVPEGEILSLPLPPETFMGSTYMPDEIKLSEDGLTLCYSRHFDERAVINEGTPEERVLHEAGTYFYETDLQKGTITLTIINE